MLEVQNLHVSIEDKEILKGVSFTTQPGKVYALMGPNGSGKSTLANALLGNPKYKITQGKILFNGQDVTEMETHERARLGMFLSFQYPAEISGVTFSNFLRTALNSVRDEKLSVLDFRKLVDKQADVLQMNRSFLSRYLNEGFSGGEKKRAEILQLLVLNPKLAILDETDSGLDIDALRVVAQGVNTFKGPDKGVLVITHYKRILEYLEPDRLLIMQDGKIVKEDGPELINHLEEKGYGWLEE